MKTCRKNHQYNSELKRCPECKLAKQLKFNKANPLKVKDRYYKSKYGISLDEYNQMLTSQNDSCKLCKKHKSNFKRSLAVDHDHKTKKVRGLLCYRCNKIFVGMHTLDTARATVKYLEATQ